MASPSTRADEIPPVSVTVGMSGNFPVATIVAFVPVKVIHGGCHPTQVREIEPKFESLYRDLNGEPTLLHKFWYWPNSIPEIRVTVHESQAFATVVASRHHLVEVGPNIDLVVKERWVHKHASLLRCAIGLFLVAFLVMAGNVSDKHWSPKDSGTPPGPAGGIESVEHGTKAPFDNLGDPTKFENSSGATKNLVNAENVSSPVQTANDSMRTFCVDDLEGVTIDGHSTVSNESSGDGDMTAGSEFDIVDTIGDSTADMDSVVSLSSSGSTAATPHDKMKFKESAPDIARSDRDTNHGDNGRVDGCLHGVADSTSTASDSRVATRPSILLDAIIELVTNACPALLYAPTSDPVLKTPPSSSNIAGDDASASYFMIAFVVKVFPPPA